MSADQPERIRTSTRITNPGCYPTGAIGLLLPLVNAGLLPADYPFLFMLFPAIRAGEGRR
jgi:N-acetyl-gamma-glutamyl-phosphate reductase